MRRWSFGAVGLVAVLALAGCGGGGSDGPTLAQQVQQALRIDNPEARARKLVQVAAKQRDAGDIAGASSSLNAAADAAKSVERPDQRTRALCDVIGAMSKGGSASEARALLKEASRAVDAVEDPSEKAQAIARLAVAHHQATKDRDIALLHLKNGEEEAQQIESMKQKATAMMQLASAHREIGSEADAERLGTSALELARGIADPRQRCDALADAAVTLARMKQADQAAAIFAEAQAEADNIDDANSRAYAYLEIARSLIAAGQKQNAGELVDKAAGMAGKVEASLRSSLNEAIDRERAKL